MKVIRKRHKLKKNRVIHNKRGTTRRAFSYKVNDKMNENILKQYYVDNISHELISPLASIEGYAKLLQQPFVAEEDRKRYAAFIENEAQRLTALSKHMLLLSYVKKQPRALSKSYYSLKTQLRQVLQLLEFQLTSKELLLKLNVSDQAMLYANKLLIHQVWLNILSNAIKHEKLGGSIEIDVQLLQHQCTVLITDHGEGMKEQQGKVFQRYYRGKQAKNAAYSGNAGLGLDIAKAIIRLHEGSISMQSNYDKGTTVTVVLAQP